MDILLRQGPLSPPREPPEILYHGTASKVVRLDASSQATIAETPTADTHASSKKYVDDNLGGAYILEPSAVLKASADTENSTTNSSYTKTKEIKVRQIGTVTVKFDAYSTNTNIADVAIYINGVLTGTENRVTTSYATYTENFAVVINDLIQVYFKTSTNSVYVKNFRVYYDKTLELDIEVITD